MAERVRNFEISDRAKLGIAGILAVFVAAFLGALLALAIDGDGGDEHHGGPAAFGMVSGTGGPPGVGEEGAMPGGAPQGTLPGIPGAPGGPAQGAIPVPPAGAEGGFRQVPPIQGSGGDSGSGNGSGSKGN